MVTHTEAPFFNNSNGKNLNKTILKAGIKKMKNTGEGICSLNLHTKLQVIWPKNEEVESISRNGRRRRRRRRRRNISKNNVAHNTTTWCCEATKSNKKHYICATLYDDMNYSSLLHIYARRLIAD